MGKDRSDHQPNADRKGGYAGSDFRLKLSGAAAGKPKFRN
jgi:hypothetical protein